MRVDDVMFETGYPIAQRGALRRSRRLIRSARPRRTCWPKAPAPGRPPGPARSVRATAATLPAAAPPADPMVSGGSTSSLSQYMFKRWQIHNPPKPRRPHRVGRPSATRSTPISFPHSDSPCSICSSPQAGERILDLGCGDGVLTEKIVAAAALEWSASMPRRTWSWRRKSAGSTRAWLTARGSSSRE